MHAVLDGLALGHLVKHQKGPEPAVGVGGDRREILGGAVVDGAVQGLAQKCASRAASWASKLIASTEMLMKPRPVCGGCRARGAAAVDSDIGAGDVRRRGGKPGSR